MRSPLRSWSGHCCSGGCHLPTIHRRTRAGRPAVLQSTRVESESCQRTSSPDNRHSVDSLHTPRCHDHTWDDLPLSHTSPPQWRDEVDCHIHGVIARAVTEAAALNRLDNNDQRHHRQRTRRRKTNQILEHIRRKDRAHTDSGC